MRIGVNAHPLNDGVSAEWVRQLGAKTVRFPVWQDALPLAVYQQFAADCVMAGASPLIVLDDRTHAARPPRQSYVVFYRGLRNLFPMVRAWQCLNEVDGAPGTASGPHSPAYTSTRIQQARVGLGPDVMLYGPGLVGTPGGGADYLAQLDPAALAALDVLCVHLYGCPPSATWPIPATGFAPIPDVLRPYARFRKPLAVTEIGGEIGLFNDEHERAQYFSRALGGLDALRVVEADVYCLTTSQGGSLGIVDNGVPLESFAAVRGAVLSMQEMKR